MRRDNVKRFFENPHRKIVSPLLLDCKHRRNMGCAMPSKGSTVVVK